MKRLILFLLILLAGVAHADTYTMPSHPRLFLRNATDPPDLTGSAWLDTLRARADGPLSSIYAVALAKAETELAAGDHKVSYVAIYAFCGLIEDRSDLRTYAIDTIIANKADVVNDVAIRNIGEISGILLAYDWMYTYMSQAQRDQVGAVIGTYLATHYNDDLTRQPWIPIYNKALALLIAVYADKDALDAYYYSGFDAAFVAQREKVTYTDTETGTSQGYLTALDESSTKGGITGYGGVRYGAMIAQMEMLKSCLGEDWTDTSTFLQNIGPYLVHLMRADNILPRTVGKYNVSDTTILPTFLSWAGSALDYDPATTLAYTMLNMSYGGGENDESGLGHYVEWSYYQVWQLVLWYQPWRGHASFPDDLYHYDNGAEIVLARDRWSRNTTKVSATDTTTVVYFNFFGGTNHSGTVASNHFAINRGNDPIVLGGGGYVDTDDDLNFWPYYSTSQNWNCLRIAQGLESYGATAAITCLAGTVTHGASGMQYLVGYESNGTNYSCDDSTAYYFPKATTWGYGGKINAVTNTDEYLYVRADNTASYTKDCAQFSAASVKREVVWVRPTRPSEISIFVVRDLVTPKTATTITTTSVLRVMDRPLPSDGSVTKVAGANWATSGDPGGVYTTTSRQIDVTWDASKATIYSLSPAAGSGTVRMVGGANSAGTFWQQNVNAGCDNYSALDPSFEYYSTTTSKNYIGAKPYTQTFSEYGVTARNLLGAEASNWRVEIAAPSSNSAHELLYVIVVGASTMTSPTVTVATAGSVETVTIVDGYITHTVSFSTTGFFTGCTRDEPCGIIY